MGGNGEKTCPRCFLPKLKTWDELSDEERMLARALPMSAEYTAKERRRHRLCTYCWLEESEQREQKA
jgi:hypothetical protein